MPGFWGGYERTSPIRTTGGIKSQSKRGAFGEKWWSRRWIDVLESFDIGSRLERGRSYARRGQVLSIDVTAGQVDARVQGSRTTPYAVRIKVQPLTEAEWKKVGEALSGQAVYAARLLSGEMPQDIEDRFKEAGISLFPGSLQEIETDCSCPDYSNPCKHIAAVYYLLGEEFDRDPFLIFKLRGLDREALVRLVGTPSAGRATADTALPVPEPIDPSAGSYWSGGDIPGELFGVVRTPPVAAPLLRRLGAFPFWRGDYLLLDSLLSTYDTAAAEGMRVFLNEMRSPGNSPE